MRAWSVLFTMSLASAAAPPASITPWAAPRGSEIAPAPWRLVNLARATPARVELVEDGGATVARIRAEAAAGSLAHGLELDAAAASMLRWRWKVDRVVERADLSRREGDDFAARVYVTFALPPAALTLWERTRLGLARTLYGDSVPDAALCYVWDNRHPVGTTAWNAYSGQVRMIVLRSGAAGVGEWRSESRDVEADFRAAFGARYPGVAPRVTGVAISADTDQTGEAVTAWFGNLVLEARR